MPAPSYNMQNKKPKEMEENGRRGGQKTHVCRDGKLRRIYNICQVNKGAQGLGGGDAATLLHLFITFVPNFMKVVKGALGKTVA